MKTIIMKTRVFLTLILIALITLNSSCVELEAIRKFAENSAVVSQKFPDLSSDYYASCVREYRYLFTGIVKFKPRLMQEIDELSSVENLAGYETAIPLDNDGYSIVYYENRCRKWKTTHKAALLLNKALVDYMIALGELAADDLTSYDKNLDALSASMTETEVFKEKHIKAGRGLAGFILNASTNFWRRKKLKSAIESRDEDVSILAEVLRKYIARNYVLQLKLEERRMNKLYIDTIKDYQNNSADINQLTILTIKSEWNERQKLLKDKMDSAEAYGKIMMNVIGGHHKLYEFRESLKSKEVRQITLQYAKNIESLIGTFRKAFKS